MALITDIYYDCDGTLVDTESIAHPALIATYKTALAQCGIENVETDIARTIEKNAGRDGGDILVEMQRKFGVTLDFNYIKAEYARCVEIGFQDVPAIDGVADSVYTFQAAGKNTCVASNSLMRYINMSLQSSGLDIYFPLDVRFSALDSLSPAAPKPDPSVYLHALEHFGTAPENAVVFEDSQTGTLAGVAAGITVIGTVAAPNLRGFLKEARAAHLLDAGAKIVIDDMSISPQIIEMLEQDMKPEDIADALPSGTYIKTNDDYLKPYEAGAVKPHAQKSPRIRPT